MKFRFKKREPLKERIDDWFTTANHRYERRIHDKCAAMQEWHEKFAWYPMRVENDDDDIREWAWLVKVTQKYNAGVQSSEWRPGKTINKFGVERYTSKDYFKKRLQGEVDGRDTTEEFVNMKHDGTDMNVQTTNTKPVYVKKKNFGDDYEQSWGKIV